MDSGLAGDFRSEGGGRANVATTGQLCRRVLSVTSFRCGMDRHEQRWKDGFKLRKSLVMTRPN